MAASACSRCKTTTGMTTGSKSTHLWTKARLARRTEREKAIQSWDGGSMGCGFGVSATAITVRISHTLCPFHALTHLHLRRAIT
eukprot:2947898-Rhodomonas_salina.2